MLDLDFCNNIVVFLFYWYSFCIRI